ncbi:non-ribosomal peptide synthetase/type I polyketide synthase [Spartinivicinus ruber]|uniref:non-ribosomal peptide synthetase/type I polyketide synthase n=1 Tax=Spartinivicinus ruber TaxID=2683272 RepID=UPI0013D2000C|nr:non-ribosomal peptide synthetase/type I polyketide synthase [Spartinivicinus ruber]
MKQKEIAVIGMACRFPQAKNYQEFWDKLIQGDSCVREIPKARWNWQQYWGDPYTEKNKTNCKWGGFLEDIDAFDAPFFQVAAKEAKSMDPQQRIMLELAWSCFEDAGYPCKTLAEKEIGVYLGISNAEYKDLSQQQKIDIQPHYSTGTAQPAIIPNRISLYFNLNGPSFFVDSVCASSLNAVHVAIQAIECDECDMALAGGINLMLTPTMSLGYAATGMLSPTGSCKTFDASADGYVRSEGAGLVLLKPLAKAIEDQDNIHGVIKGSAVRHVGKVSTITTPNAEAQAKTIHKAQQRAGVDPTSIQFFQVHGTGTPVGDPIEVEGLKQAWELSGVSKTSKAYCGISSVKSIIGHTEAASGIAGLIATLLAFKHNMLPGLASLNDVNPNIDLEDSPFYIVKTPLPWHKPNSQDGRSLRRAGVSAFGFGGVNVHVVLEEYISSKNSQAHNQEGENTQLVVLSAKEEAGLKRRAEDLLLYFEACTQEQLPSFNDIIFTLIKGRDLMPQVLAFFAKSNKEIIQGLKAFLDEPAAKSNDKFTPDFIRDIQEVQKKLKHTPLNVGQRVPLPTYPFAKNRYWFEGEGLDVSQQKDSDRLTYYRPIWENRLLDNAAINNASLQEMNWIFIDHRDELSLQTQIPPQENIIWIKMGESYQQNGVNNYTLRAGCSKEIEKLVYILKEHKGLPQKVFFLWPLDIPGTLTLDNLSVSSKQSIYTVVSLIQTLTKQEHTDYSFLYLYSGRFPEENPLHWTLSGFSKSLKREHPQSILKLLHVDEYDQNTWPIVVKESQANKEELLVSYQKEKRLVHSITEISKKELQKAKQNPKASLKKGGTYLITGGMGGLGRIFSSYLVDKYQANIILVGRSAINEEQQSYLQSFLQRGANVKYYPLDITDFDSVANLFAQLESDNFSLVDSVFHTAGLITSFEVENDSLSNFKTLISPKISGTLVLNKLQKQGNFQQLFLFSSISAFGFEGSSSYGAANAFLDAFAMSICRQRSDSVFSINWPLWESEGMTLIEGVKDNLMQPKGLGFLSEEHGLQSFEAVLKLGIPQVLINDGDQGRFFQTFSTPIKSLSSSVPKKSTSLGISNHQDLMIKIREWIAEILGINATNIAEEENFINYGMDSIVSIRVVYKIRASWSSDIPMNALLNYPSLKALSNYLKTFNKESTDSIKSTNTLASAIEFCNYMPLIKEGKGRPIFVFPALWGNCSFYRYLLEEVTERPVYGGYSFGFQGEAEPFNRIKTIASFYLDYILAIQKLGPFDLMGYSFGGMVAYEVTQQLIQAGYCIGFLGLIDTYSAWKPLSLSMGLKAISPSLSIQPEAINGLSKERIVALVKEKGRDTIPAFFGTDSLKVFESNQKALVSYQPKNYIGSNRVYFFDAQKKNPKDFPSYKKNWLPLIGDKLITIPISGDHFQCIQKEQASLWKFKLKAAFLQANKVAIFEMPLSFGQLALFAYQQKYSDSYAYNIPLCIMIPSELNVNLWKQACQLFVDYHPILKTRIRLNNEGTPIQWHDSHSSINFELADFRNKKFSEIDIKQYITKESQRAFSIERDVLCRFHLLQVNKNEWYFLTVIHHIIFDEHSVSLIQELFDFYQLLQDKKAPQFHEKENKFYEFIAWQNEFVQSEASLKQLSYWRESLKGCSWNIELPFDSPLEKKSSDAGDSLVFYFEKEEVDAIKKIANSNGVTLFSLFFTVYAILLAKYSNQDVILIGTPSLGRNKSDHESSIGCFINLLPLLCSISEDDTFLSLLKKISNIVKNGLANQDYPFPKLMQELKVTNQAWESYPIQAFFEILSFEENLTSNKYQKQYPSFTIKGYSIPIHEGIFPLSLILNPEVDGRIKVSWKYRTDHFKAETIKRFANSFNQILSQLRSAIDLPISDISILNSEERQALLVDWNQTEKIYPKEICLHQVFEKQAQETPQATAVKINDQTISYAELNNKANCLALYLQSLGIKPDDLVGICVEKSLDMTVAVFGVLKAGAAFVPLDPHYPKERLSYMIEDSQISVLLSQRKLNTELPFFKKIIYLDLDWPTIRKTKGTLKNEVRCDHLAYVIYTSGSTGKPKGVMIEHKAILNTIWDGIQRFNIKSTENIGQFSSFSFDVGLYDIFTALLSGASLVLIPYNIQKDTHKFTEYFYEHQISSIALMPSFIKSLNQVRLPSLKRLITAGERANPSDLNYYARDADVVNGYGPTEYSVLSTYFEMKQNISSIPIGKPLFNTKLYILDDKLNPVPIGVPGELYISGAGLARGYLNRPELTEKSFIINPFVDPKDPKLAVYHRMYKSGDLCKFLSDGNIEWLDRVDTQVKIRGFRIELGEIEENIKQHHHVKNAVVVVQGAEENKRLVAFYLADTTLTAGELKSYLTQKLPSYMIPSFWMKIDKFPLTSSGKIDRKVLQQNKVSATSEVTYHKPKTEIEEKIHQIWLEGLQLTELSIHDYFFDVGGNSLNAIKITYMLQKHGFNISVTDLFSRATIANLASLVAHQVGLSPKVSEKSTAIPSNIDKQSKEEIKEIAIIGMSCRLPGASNVQKFWENLQSGKESIQFFSEQELRESGVSESLYHKPNYVKAMGWLEGIEYFDAEFFGYADLEAMLMDPQHRIFLELCYHALEDASYNLDKQSRHIGVYGGSGINFYEQYHLHPHYQQLERAGKEDAALAYQRLLANAPDFLCSRVTYKLDLTGPAVVLQTACSTSATAVDKACQDIREGRCDLALAGGISLLGGFGKKGYLYQQGMIASPDGHCRPFDEKAQGTVLSHGGGVVLLKSLSKALEDGDNIYAVIRGSAMHNDGAEKVSYAAPSVEGQQKTIELALENANLTADQIGYVEAHGTGTNLGDPLEVRALNAAFQGMAKQDLQPSSCAIGSVKSNLGHTDSAAGVVSIIKTALCLKHQSLVPTLHYQTPNPKIGFDETPFYVNTQFKYWENAFNTPRRASVNSTGIGGNNVHLILEEAPEHNKKSSISQRRYHLFPFSAKSPTSLISQIASYETYLSSQPTFEIADLAFSLQVGRRSMTYRKTIQAKDLSELQDKLKAAQIQNSVYKEPCQSKVIFLFSGQGSQYVDMAQYFYTQEPEFQKTLDHCFSILKSQQGLDLASVIYPHSGLSKEESTSAINQTRMSQPALFCIEYSLAKLWESYGITPDLMVGHSVGEYVAACLAGVFSLESALEIVSHRGALMQSLPGGKMLSMELSEVATKTLLSKVFFSEESRSLDIAVLNHPNKTVVSGETESINRLKEYCDWHKIRVVTLHTSHAFHSSMMEPILDEFQSTIANHSLDVPKVPYISNVTGDWITKSQACDPKYWANHLRNPVRYHEGVSTLLNQLREEKLNGLFIEVGPGQVLRSLTSLHPGIGAKDLILSSTGHHLDPSLDEKQFQESLGLVWEKGYNVNLGQIYKREQRVRLTGLPVYPFVKKRCWVEKPVTEITGETRSIRKENIQKVHHKKLKNKALSLEQVEQIVSSIWSTRFNLNLNDLMDKDFFTLGGDSLMAVSLIAEVNQTLNIEVPTHQLATTPSFQAFLNAVYQMKPVDTSTYLDHQKSVFPDSIDVNQEKEELIVPLSQKEADKILYLIHPIGGEVYFYRPLADALRESFEVYGIRSRRGSVKKASYTVEEMATSYLREIDRHSKGKEYYLGGSSLGGLIAYEIGQQRLSMGRKMYPILMIDTPHPGYFPELNKTPDHVLNYLFGDQVKIELSILEKLSKLESKLDYIAGLFASSGRESSFVMDITQKLIDSWLSQSEGLYIYQPTTYAGEVYYVGHKERKAGFPDGAHHAWEKLINRFYYSQTSGGNHITMNYPPYIEEIADVIQSYV